MRNNDKDKGYLTGVTERWWAVVGGPWVISAYSVISGILRKGFAADVRVCYFMT